MVYIRIHGSYSFSASIIFMTLLFLLRISGGGLFLVFFSLLFLFISSVRQIKLAIRQLLGACKYSGHIVSCWFGNSKGVWAVKILSKSFMGQQLTQVNLENGIYAYVNIWQLINRCQFAPCVSAFAAPKLLQEHSIVRKHCLFVQNIQKMLGFAPSRAANKQGSGFFTTPSQAGK